MEFLTRGASVRDRIRLWRDAGARVALVPTSGNLHKGHMSLIAEAQERASHVVVSIFTDPRESAAPTHEADRDLLQKIGATLAFAPPLQEMYPNGREFAATVDVPGLARILEGVSGPGSPTDSLTAIAKLLNLVKPDIAVFGERDFQQLAMVRRMVDDLFLPVDIVGCATLREGDGLSVATVNRHLTGEERAAAPRLYAILKEGAAKMAEGARDYERLQMQGMESLAAAGFVPEYFEIRRAADLGQVRTNSRDLVILAAVRLNALRLTDNLRVRLIDRH